jgi:hypothetical protein
MHHCDGSFASSHLENVATCFIGKWTFQHVGSRHFRVFYGSHTTEGTTASRFHRCQRQSTNATFPHSNNKGTQFKVRIWHVPVSLEPFHVGYLRRDSLHWHWHVNCSATRHFAHTVYLRDVGWSSEYSTRASRNIMKRLIFVRQAEDDFLAAKSRLK